MKVLSEYILGHKDAFVLSCIFLPLNLLNMHWTAMVAINPKAAIEEKDCFGTKEPCGYLYHDSLGQDHGTMTEPLPDENPLFFSA